MDADDPLYDELYDNYSGLIRGFTSEIVDIDRQMDEVRANIDTNGARRESVDRLKDTIAEMRDHIGELSDDKVKTFMKSFIAEIHILVEQDVIQGNNYWVKRIRFKVPLRVSETEEGDTFNVEHSFQPKEQHVERKLCVSFYTRNYENILKMYPETDYNIQCKDIGKDPYREVYVARKGCLSDYYNIDEIDEWYTMKGINLNSRLFEDLCEVEMIDLIYGEYQTSYCVVDFSIKMNFDEFDDSLLAYQNEGVAVTGLLLGYPLESTSNLIEALLLLDDRYGWISNKM